MGKAGGSRQKSYSTKNTSVKAFFPAGDSKGALSPQTQQRSDMDAAEDKAPPEASPDGISRSELTDILDSLEGRFAQKVESLLKPLHSQLQELKSSLQAVSQTAESALEQAITTQEEIRSLQSGEKRTHERLLDLENSYRFKNLKFRGFGDSAEGTVDLPIFLASWLATELNLEKGILPEIDRAYRIGPRAVKRPNFQRDIIVRFRDFRTRNKILKEANARGSFTFQDAKIAVFPDLSPETLQRRRDLRPITSCLQTANIPYRWVSHCRLSVMHQGKALQASDLDSGKDLLFNLGLPAPDFPSATGSPRSNRTPSWKRFSAG